MLHLTVLGGHVHVTQFVLGALETPIWVNMDDQGVHLYCTPCSLTSLSLASMFLSGTIFFQI